MSWETSRRGGPARMANSSQPCSSCAPLGTLPETSVGTSPGQATRLAPAAYGLPGRAPGRYLPFTPPPFLPPEQRSPPGAASWRLSVRARPPRDPGGRGESELNAAAA